MTLTHDYLERLLKDILYEKRENEDNHGKSHGKNSKHRLKLEDIEKSELNLHSLAQDYAERQLDYLPDGAHKPKNLNKKEKEEELALDRDVHKMSTRFRIPNKSAKRTFYHDIGWRWPNRTIYYVIDYPSFDPYIANAEDKIKSSLALFEEAACIHWVEVTEASASNNYIKFYGNTTSCASYVGYIGRTEQKIWLGPGCLWTSIVLHEVLHALGAWHEQQRTDREENICVLFENIKPGAEGNFERQHIHEYAPYNLGSVLQYGLSSFAKQQGLQTMTLPDKDLEYLITNSKDDLSFYDKLNLNMYYECPATCSLTTCSNGGFAKMNYLGVCSCECPDGLKGSDCSELDTSNNCGGIIDLASPGSSQFVEMTSYNTNLLCTWLIKAPLKTMVRATIEYLDLPDSTNNNCLHFLIFKDYLIGEPGKQACGNTPGAVYTKHLLGAENMMMIRFDSISYPQISPGTGFRIKVEAIPSGCYSHPCKFGATCHEGTSIDQYTCSCPEGFSGQNCDYVTANATVRSTFEKDYTGSIFQQDPTSEFWWSIVSKHNFDGTSVYPHSGTLFATMIPYLTIFYLHTRTKLRTEATFEATERCLNITYIMDNKTNPSYPQYYTKLIVTVLDGESLLNEYTISGDTQTTWRNTLVDLPAVNDLKVEITGVYGWNTFGMDDLFILPSSCGCVNHRCLNGQCIPNGEVYTCQCNAGYSGNYCEIPDAVDGGYTDWSAWSTCTASCGEGTQTRTRTCTNPPPQNGGADCVGESTQTQTCNIQGCPIDGGYTNWSAWSTCTVSCGGGTQTRTRTCTNPAPQNGGADCVGSSSESQSCNNILCPIDGGYTEWSVWSTCTVSCGSGTRTRTRTCTNPTPANGGAECVGDSSQTENCNTQECPIDGGYTEWSDWSTCTVSCGGGTQTRTRTCTNPTPTNGGAECEGESGQIQNCNTYGCPITSSKCDFEEEIENNCFLEEGINDDFDWTRHSGGTDTRRTGPGRAYTGYFYKYIEANDKEPYSTAELVSNGVFADATYCFEFYNHMKGNHMGSLEVITVEGGNENTVVRLDTSRKGWMRYYTTLQLNGQTQLILRGTRGFGNKGDIAVDNISISIC
ncbi:MAM and LDL-receptor class A domain-containing protein 2-like [Saccostrea echinata]|uniref:MAM and LDL-receptor class A domain-containing protein 2-like n=1 Tax=Saccostrea echinata TaxID=191078 RepID=UPI002A817912|nr:MAM and LDL-receptor class A domain-containing protein 2-like [Saccostrea echinata]